jgi:hypothetical protein
LHEQLGVEHDKIAATIATIGKLTEPTKEVVKEEDSDEEL